MRKFNQNNTVNIQPNPPKKISIKSQINLIKVRDNSKEVLEESNKNQDILIFKENKENINKLEKINKIKTDDNKNEEIIEMIIKNVEKEKRIKYFNNEELNSLKYKYALEIDDRTYIQYYWSLLKNKHLIIFTFIANDDYNIFLLKLSFFLISFSLYFAVNAMFFSDDTIHKQYEDKGKYNFVYQLPKILYLTIISVITNMLLKKLSLSQNDILKIKHNVDINKAKEQSKKVQKCLKLKFILFIIFGFLLLFFFWYYLSCFCSVFANTQIPLIKDTIISYIMSMLYPFVLNLLPGFLRIPALKKNSRKILYIISKIIALI